MAVKLMPLDDPDNVDERRLKWDVEAYKKKLPDIEAKSENQ